MTEDDAEQAVRELVERYAANLFAMSSRDLARLAEAVDVLGQQRVFRIAAEHVGRTRFPS